MNRWGPLNNWRNPIKSCGVCLWCNMGKICWGGHRGKATACLKTNFITAEPTTTASCWLALRWHYSCTASIVLHNPHCSHWGHTIVPAWYTVKALTSLWNKSMRQTLVNPERSLKPRCVTFREARQTAFSWTPGSCPLPDLSTCV